MVGPPKYVKAVEVLNTTEHAVHVTVEYENVKGSGEEMKATKSIAPGASERFDEKLADMGTWEAVCPVKAVHSSSGASNALFAPQPSAIVALQQLSVSKGAGGALEIVAR